jgi:gamma-glutamyl hercynylcysteine S-oxide hydrolase
MCRHLAFVGDPAVLAWPLFDAPHALARQAEHPRHQVSGTTNPDGWGVAWYPRGRGVPEHHRTTTPIWDDVEFADRARSLTGTAVLAAARLASPGATIVETGNAPFVSGPWAFSLNGIVDGFAGEVGSALRALLEPARVDALVGDADTEVLFALVLQHLAAGAQPSAALARVIEQVTARTTGRLNLLLTDGEAVYATRYGNSLFGRGGTLASEPLDDDPAWREIRDQSVVVVGRERASIASL